jgi:RNA polymerase sigma-70 factor (ECF subfamily)
MGRGGRRGRIAVSIQGGGRLRIRGVQPRFGSSGPLSDAEALEGLLGRNEEVLTEVVRTHGDAVHGMARRVVVDHALAEEVAQDTFVALWRRPGVFDPERGTLRGFLLGVARNKAIDLVRKQESVRRLKERLLDEVQTSLRTASSDSALASADERTAMMRALKVLPKAQLEPLVLAYFGGRTYREAAVELGIPEGTAKSRLRDGLAALKAELTNLRGGN